MSVERSTPASESCAVDQAFERDTAAEADFEHAVRRRKLKLKHRECVHARVVAVHQPADDPTKKTLWVRKLSRDEMRRCHAEIAWNWAVALIWRLDNDGVSATDPGYRFAHPGYRLLRTAMRGHDGGVC